MRRAMQADEQTLPSAAQNKTIPIFTMRNDVIDVRYRPDIGIVGARFAWYLAVIAIVLGHVIAVAVAHTVALREYVSRRTALRSQLPMLVLMVGYTMVSLWIIAQPIVETSVSATVTPPRTLSLARTEIPT
jgi:hypothetical protein